MNEKLLAALPKARKVLELVSGTPGPIGQKYRELHPDADWKTVNAKELLSADAQAHEGADLILFDGLLERMTHAAGLLAFLKKHHPLAGIVCSIANMSHVSVIERLLIGDISYEAGGLLSEDVAHFYSASSAFKLFLNSGWLPSLVDNYAATHSNPEFMTALTELAQKLGVPPQTAQRNFLIHHLIINCTPAEPLPLAEAPGCSLACVVPVTNPLQLQLNVMASPGLREIGAEIIPVQKAASAAEAFELGCKATKADWILYCHQDVYLPAGSGKALLAMLSGIRPQDARSLVIGFAGLASAKAGDATATKAGLVTDRVNAFDFPASNEGVSIDELAVVLHRESSIRPDPALGWHTWATDLCLQSILRSEAKNFARIVRIPIYHNSLSGWSLPQAYYASAKKLHDKYSELAAIPTLCGIISRSA